MKESNTAKWKVVKIAQKATWFRPQFGMYFVQDGDSDSWGLLFKIGTNICQSMTNNRFCLSLMYKCLPLNLTWISNIFLLQVDTAALFSYASLRLSPAAISLSSALHATNRKGQASSPSSAAVAGTLALTTCQRTKSWGIMSLWFWVTLELCLYHLRPVLGDCKELNRYPTLSVQINSEQGWFQNWSTFWYLIVGLYLISGFTIVG